MAAKAPSPAARSTSKQNSHPKKKKVLLIEDECSASELLAFRLKKMGFDVLIAPDGARGLEEAFGNIPDLIILDLMLPKLPGEEVCKAIRESYNEEIASIPIIMLTGKDSTADKVLGKVIGANAYLTKPYEFEALTKEISKLTQKGK